MLELTATEIESFLHEQVYVRLGCRDNGEVHFLPGNWRSVIVQGQYEELGGEDSTRAPGLLSARFGKRWPSAEPAPPAEEPILAFCNRILAATGRAVRRA